MFSSNTVHSKSPDKFVKEKKQEHKDNVLLEMISNIDQNSVSRVFLVQILSVDLLRPVSDENIISKLSF